MMKQEVNNRVELLEALTLEDRMMLSTVSILASGDTGQETMNLVVDDQVVQTWENVASEQRFYTFETEEPVSLEQVKITFTNDLYAPDQGIDRNLTVELVVVDGVEFYTNDPSVLSGGVWNPVVGAIQTGFGQGETLHANGFFQFFDDPLVDIEFAGRIWDVVEGVPTADDLFIDNVGSLTLGGARGPLAISTQLDDIQAGVDYRLRLDANREFISGPVGANGPWSTVGVNFYDAGGGLISQEQVEINSQAGVSGDQIVTVPNGTTTAYLWAWIDDYNDPNDTFIPLKISAVDWQVDDTVNPDDNTPPGASFDSFTFDRFGDSSLNFGVNFTDNQELAQISSGVVTVTAPSGELLTPPIAIGAPTNTDTDQTLVFTLGNPFGGDWGPDANGVYTVTLRSAQLRDAAGNAAGATDRVLGTITVDIETPVDTTAPYVTLLSNPGVITAPPTGGRGSDVEFTVEYTDDVGLGDLAQDRILVEGPNGYSGFGRGIAGGGAAPNGFFEITFIPLPSDGFWSSNENGTYTITLVDGAVVDEFGNATAGRQLGTFEINIPDVEVG